MKCVICKKETLIVCLCGYCPECIDKYTHQGCSDIISNEKYGLKYER